ncbi:elongation of very long chain fatty acids protein 6-like [Clupea harengus]|uniref:Elongation of very long chain fatty acids protein n=1 Tax=Clupea harengus TaxID=7950 RepID=A0A6P3VNP2_CLUHA|nr:elongation of very long chain fatty acids protein 6-like [Clupea harengus]
MNETDSVPLAEYEFERLFDEKVAFQWMEDNWRQSFVFCAMYAAVIFAVQLYMRERPKLDLRTPLVLWSLSLAVFSIIATLRTGGYMLHVLNSSGFRQSVCDTSFYSAPVSKFWAYLFVLSKLPELGDTVFIVLRKQPLIFLHWYHHITVLIYSWYSYKDRVAGGGWFMTMNYGVHSLMYTYYAARAARLRLPRPVAMVITSTQILQMAMGLVVLGSVHQWMDASECPSNVRNVVWGVVMYLSYLVLFVFFFYKSYVRGGKAEKTVKAE